MTSAPFAAFLLSAAALLGSPGPGIAALMLAGRQSGWVRAQPFFWGLQSGLAIASALCAFGVAAAILAVPALLPALMLASSLYLLWLAVQIIRTASHQSEPAAGLWSAGAGLWIGISNPKSLLVFVTLFGSQLLVVGNQAADSALKWVLTVLVMILVDLAWLAIGVWLGSAALSPAAHRRVNLVFGLVLGAAALPGLGEALSIAMKA